MPSCGALFRLPLIKVRFNQFVQWVSFGGDSVIAENTRDEQRKFIKYNHLVANHLVANHLVFHNIVTLSRALERFGQTV